MKHVICTFAPATRNEHRTYFVRMAKYAVIRETACFFYVLDEMGFERRVSKKTGNETGYKAGHAAEFSEIMEQAEAMNAATVSRRDAIETMIESMDDAISDRDILAAREWKAGIKAAVEAAHAEALEMDKPGFRAFWAASDFSVMVNALEAFNASHAEALELDAEHDAAQLVSEAIRIANRGHGHWITGAQVAAMLADGKEYTAAQLARAVVNQAKEAAQLEQYAAQLVAGQHDYTTAADASEAALNAAVEASADGTEDTPEFAAYEAAEETLTEKIAALLQACGRYAVELARKMGKTAAEVDALKQMFMPAFTGNTENMHPGRRNELVAKALAINPTQAA